jgi:bacillopeptidase F
MRRSRLNKNFEKKSQKTLILSIIGILIVLFLLFRFGIDLLVNFSTFISGSKGSQTAQQTNQINYIAPPILNPLVSATNSAQIVITGKGTKGQTINLYINNSQIDQIQTDQNGVFAFTESLKNGDNQIKTRAENNGKQSDFSNAFDVVFKNSAPTLDISSPSDGQRFDKNSIGSGNSISVSGKTDQGVSVTVNGFWAVVDDNNNFSYTLPLQNGDNQIKIIAIDQAGNKIEKDIKVNYSQ